MGDNHIDVGYLVTLLNLHRPTMRGVFAAQLALQLPQLPVDQRAHGRRLALAAQVEIDSKA